MHFGKKKKKKGRRPYLSSGLSYLEFKCYMIECTHALAGMFTPAVLVVVFPPRIHSIQFTLLYFLENSLTVRGLSTFPVETKVVNLVWRHTLLLSGREKGSQLSVEAYFSPNTAAVVTCEGTRLSSFCFPSFLFCFCFCCCTSVLSHWDFSHGEIRAVFPRGKPAATESRYPTYGACWVF